jgi:hypothetical protein
MVPVVLIGQAADGDIVLAAGTEGKRLPLGHMVVLGAFRA